MFEAYPEVFDARFFGLSIASPSREVVTQAAFGSQYVLMAGNLGEQNLSGPLRFPFKADALEDLLTGEKIGPDRNGAFPINLLSNGVSFWRIVPTAAAP